MALVKRPQRTPDRSTERPSQTAAQLLNTLSEGSSDERRDAARELAEQVGSAAALAGQFAKEPDRATRQLIGTALVGHADAVANAQLAQLLKVQDAALRNDARDVLLMMPGGEKAVEPLFQDVDPHVRIFALEVLAVRLGERAGDELVKLMAREPDLNVCASIVEYLAQVGARRHLTALDELVKRAAGDAFVGFSVDEARARIEERAAAAEALGRTS